MSENRCHKRSPDMARFRVGTGNPREKDAGRRKEKKNDSEGRSRRGKKGRRKGRRYASPSPLPKPKMLATFLHIGSVVHTECSYLLTVIRLCQMLVVSSTASSWTQTTNILHYVCILYPDTDRVIACESTALRRNASNAAGKSSKGNCGIVELRKGAEATCSGVTRTTARPGFQRPIFSNSKIRVF